MAVVVEPRPYQIEPLGTFYRRGNILLAFDTGLGKQQPVSEPVLTPTGWRPIGDLEPGDQVIGRDGCSTEVTGVFPQTDRRVFKVTFNDGSFTFAGVDHLWSVQDSRNDTQRHPDRWRVMSTHDLLEAGLRNGSGLRWRIPMVSPVNFDGAKEWYELPIEPYLLGVLLGDGGITQSVTVSSADEFILNMVREQAPYGVRLVHRSGYDYALTVEPGKPNPLRRALSELGLMGLRSHMKHVPGMFLRAAPRQRLELLQGLMDTDGYPLPDGGAEFTTVSKQLLEEVVFLVQSLGGIARIGKPRRPSYEHKGEKKLGRLTYRVNIKLPAEMCPFRLPRKVAVWVRPTKYQVGRIIKSIEFSHQEDSVCISVAAADQLYVTRSFIVTHNTYCAVAAAEELLESARVDRVLLVVPAGLKWQWAEAIARFTDLPAQRKRFKNEWLTIPDSRYCMVIDGPPAKRRKQYRMARETASCNYVIVGYDNVDSDTRDVKRIQADMCVLDEATAIKTMSAARTISVKEHLGGIRWRMALTATPIDNRPDELFSIMEWVDATVLGRGDLFDLAYVERNIYGDPTGYRNLPVLRRRLGDAMHRKSVTDPDVAPFMPRRDILNWPVEMNPSTRVAYTRMCYDLLEALAEAAAKGRSGFSIAAHYAGRKPDESTPVGKVMAIHTAMEMLLDHPDVLFASALAYLEDDDGEAGSKYAASIVDDILEITVAPKLARLTEKLAPLIVGEITTKVIIFTRYRRMQEIIEHVLTARGWNVATFHGELTTAEQQAARTRFLRDPECRIFLSTHAGERGTDLPVANWLVNYEPVWSAGKADQINGRHMRTSSEYDDIFVANMYVEGSVEERKLDQQDDKRRVSQAVVDGKMPSTGRVDNTAESLKAHITAWLLQHDPGGMVALTW